MARSLIGRAGWLAVVLASGLTWIARLRRRPVGLIVVYHGLTGSLAPHTIVPVVTRAQLAADLERYRRNYRPVALENFGAAMRARRIGGRIPLAITFDDDLESHLTIALPLLEEAGVQATFFVAGDDAACSRAYWWEPLQIALDRGAELPAHPKLDGCGRDPEAVAAAMLAMPEAERQAATAELWRELAPTQPPAHLSRDGLDRLVRAGHRLGFHTRDHPVLTRLNPVELNEAVTAGLDAVAAAAARDVRAFAYPYGISDARVRAAVAAAGFVQGFTTEPCAVSAHGDPLRVGRVDAAAGSSPLLAFRLARALHRGSAA